MTIKSTISASNLRSLSGNFFSCDVDKVKVDGDDGYDNEAGH